MKRIADEAWVAVVFDRHIDPQATIHASRDDAIKYARQAMNDFIAHPDGLYEEDQGSFWIMKYRYEQDYAIVVEAQT